MRKSLLFFGGMFLASSLVACDYILKPKSKNKTTDTEGIENIILGPDNDANDCVASAGYRWSEIDDSCIRIFERGLRLVPANAREIAEDDDEVDLAKVNAYLLFNSDKTKAEVFLNALPQSLVMQQTSDGLYVFENWQLQTTNGYRLSENNIVKYVSPTAVEKQIDGSLEYDPSDAIITQ
ncbi:hypothetical protein K5I29_05955 [Flavobacterium agricola]|uniref:Lipoprotein n=1 Tax=Flavobacterium agricola TaxID=2870839 RepID=A0ABY6M1J2_9FLAO|nr:hypothetical protein [Flavobacterium agricola]UYW02434.1 hypothetical protein K5I29_05955 [Flavobacterium agricola]